MNTKNSVFSNMVWRFAERCGAQLITFVVSIVLARLLAPEDYGKIALITVFTTILQVFVDSGLGTALIQKKDSDDLDFSSVFYFNFIVCLVLYAGMFFVAPFIAKFYEDISLTPIVRVISLTIIISGVKGIQQSYVSKNMLFNLNAIKAMGRSDLFLKLEIAKKIVGMILLLSTMWFGVMAMAYSLLVSMITSMIINSWPNRQLLNYSFKEQMIDIFPSVTLAVVMGIAISFINFFEFSSALTLLIKVPTGALIYIFGSKLLHLDSFEYLLEISKTLIHKK